MDKKINVLFVFHLISTFSGFESVYHYMKNTSEFNPIMLLTPCMDRRLINYDLGKTKDTLEKNKISYIFFNKRFNLDDVQFVFLNVPYLGMYPQNLIESIYNYRDRGKLKICHFSYGYNIWHLNLVCGLGSSRSCDYYFTENIYNTQSIVDYYDRYNISYRCKFFDTGTPKIEKIKLAKNKSNVVLCCPRWTIKHSTFDRYKDTMITIAMNYKDIKILYRPHPLDQHKESRKKLSNFSQKLENLEMDDNEEYIDTFNSTQLLVSGMSTMIPEFFATGNPIVYTEASSEVRWNPFGDILFKGVYIVKNKKELKGRILDIMLNGNDPLKKVRMEIIEKYYKIYKPSENICKILKDNNPQ